MRSARKFFTSPFCGFVVAGVSLLASIVLEAQPNQFQFIVGATDASGMPVTDIKPDEVIMTENGAAATVLKIEPYKIPVKLTIAVDNGPDSREALSHYRSGLKGLIEALPPDLEMTLITTAPQPRMVVRPTTSREQILRGVNGFAPDEERPRFTDTLVEYSQRLQRELRGKRGLPDSLPIIVMVSTTANEATSYQVPEIEKALSFLATRKARLMVTMTSTRATAALRKAGDLITETEAAGVGDLNTNRQALIAIPTVKATRGRYEAIAVTTRLATLLPEFGKDIAVLHAKHVNQFRVTVERANNATGPFRNLQIELARPGLTGSVSVDGLP
jgi:hypothetical protein